MFIKPALNDSYSYGAFAFVRKALGTTTLKQSLKKTCKRIKFHVLQIVAVVFLPNVISLNVLAQLIYLKLKQV
jgi:hypothetical protein